MARKAKQASGAAPLESLLRDQQYEIVPASELHCHSQNPREGDIGGIHVSIGAHKFYGALIVQRSSGTIIKGNHSFQAGVQKGIDRFPIFWIDCDDKEALEILLIDNRTSDLASYNNAALADLLQGLSNDGGIQGTGYDQEALDNLLHDLSSDLGVIPIEKSDEDGLVACPKCGTRFRL